MTTLEIKTDLRLKIKEKSATQLLSIYENNQAKLESGSDIEEGMLINQRFENLQAMCELVGDLMEEIKDAAKAKDRHEHSMKEMGLYAYKFLSQLETEVGF